MDRKIILVLMIAILLVLPLSLGPRGNYSYEQRGGPDPAFSYIGENITAMTSFKASGFSYFAFAFGNDSSTLRMIRLNDLSQTDLELDFRVSELAWAGGRLIAMGTDRVLSVDPSNPDDRSEIEAMNVSVGEDYLVVYSVTIRDLGNAVQYVVVLQGYSFGLERILGQIVTVNASYPGEFSMGVLEANNTVFLAISYPSGTKRTAVYAINETVKRKLVEVEGFVLTDVMGVLDSVPFFTLENQTGAAFLYSLPSGILPLPDTPEGFMSLPEGTGIMDFDGDGSPEILVLGNSTISRVDLSSGVDLAINLSGKAILVPTDYDWDGWPDILEFNNSMVTSISTKTGLHLWRYDAPPGYSLDVGQFRLWRLRGLDVDFDDDGFPDILANNFTALGDTAILNLTLVSGMPPFDTIRTYSGVADLPVEASLVESGVRPLAVDLVGGKSEDFVAYAKLTNMGKSWIYLYAVFSSDKSSPPMLVEISWTGGDLGGRGGPILASEWGTWYSLGLYLGTGISLYGFTVPWIGELPW